RNLQGALRCAPRLHRERSGRCRNREVWTWARGRDLQQHRNIVIWVTGSRKVKLAIAVEVTRHQRGRLVRQKKREVSWRKRSIADSRKRNRKADCDPKPRITDP